MSSNRPTNPFLQRIFGDVDTQHLDAFAVEKQAGAQVVDELIASVLAELSSPGVEGSQKQAGSFPPEKKEDKKDDKKEEKKESKEEGSDKEKEDKKEDKGKSKGKKPPFPQAAAAAPARPPMVPPAPPAMPFPPKIASEQQTQNMEESMQRALQVFFGAEDPIKAAAAQVVEQEAMRKHAEALNAAREQFYGQVMAHSFADEIEKVAQADASGIPFDVYMAKVANAR